MSIISAPSSTVCKNLSQNTLSDVLLFSKNHSFMFRNRNYPSCRRDRRCRSPCQLTWTNSGYLATSRIRPGVAQQSSAKHDARCANGVIHEIGQLDRRKPVNAAPGAISGPGGLRRTIVANRTVPSRHRLPGNTRHAFDGRDAQLICGVGGPWTVSRQCPRRAARICRRTSLRTAPKSGAPAFASGSVLRISHGEDGTPPSRGQGPPPA